MKIKLLVLSVFVVTIISCKNENLTYKPLSESNFQMTKLNDQTELEIISFSGGKYCNQETDYYYQFIVKNLSNGDTVRILSPCQEYKIDESPRKGYYSDMNYLKDIFNNPKVESNLFKENKTKMVVYNQENEIFESQNYKTAIGTINFK